MDEDVKMWLWLAGMAATAIGVVIAVRRKAKTEQWQEQPCRSYKPELDDEAKAES